MHRLYRHFGFSAVPFLWSHRRRSEAGIGFAGYDHWHQGCELLLVHEGRGIVLVGRHAYPLQSGMLFFFQPCQLHNVRVDLEPGDSAYVRSTFHFDPIALEPYLKPFAALDRLFAGLLNGADPVQGFVLADLAGAADSVFAAFERSASGRPDKDELADRAGLLLVQLLAAIRDRTDAAARRVKLACRLLRTTDLSVERIGQEVGLPNASYFTQLFRRTVGTTPLRYRTGADRNGEKET